MARTSALPAQPSPAALVTAAWATLHPGRHPEPRPWGGCWPRCRQDGREGPLHEGGESVPPPFLASPGLFGQCGGGAARGGGGGAEEGETAAPAEASAPRPPSLPAGQGSQRWGAGWEPRPGVPARPAPATKPVCTPGPPVEWSPPGPGAGSAGPWWVGTREGWRRLDLSWPASPRARAPRARVPGEGARPVWSWSAPSVTNPSEPPVQGGLSIWWPFLLLLSQVWLPKAVPSAGAVSFPEAGSLGGVPNATCHTQVQGHAYIAMQTAHGSRGHLARGTEAPPASSSPSPACGLT